MADKYWEPKQVPTAQVSTVQVTAFDVTTTYRLTVNGVIVASALGDTDEDTTATNLRAAWAASTHPYTSAAVATVATDTITLTGVLEVPFTVTSSVNGVGAGTIGAVATPTAATGPHHLDEAVNWDAEALPSNSDVLYFRDNSNHIAWGLGGLSTTGHTLVIEQSFTGKIGLAGGYAYSADGQTVDTAAPEYQTAYMTLDCSRIDVGELVGATNPGGSQRIMIDNDRAGASQLVVHNTGAQGSETGKPPMRYLAANASAHVEVRSGQMGIGVGIPGETPTVGNVVLTNGSANVGDGCTLTNFTQHAGASHLSLKTATVTKIQTLGGEVTVDGDQAVTTLHTKGGRTIFSATGTVTTVTHEGGEIDYSQGKEARTVTTHQLYRGAVLMTDDDVVTITNLLEPDGNATITVS